MVSVSSRSLCCNKILANGRNYFLGDFAGYGYQHFRESITPEIYDQRLARDGKEWARPSLLHCEFTQESVSRVKDSLGFHRVFSKLDFSLINPSYNSSLELLVMEVLPGSKDSSLSWYINVIISVINYVLRCCQSPNF